MKVSQTDMCFACGKKNPCGLKLTFKFENGKTISRFSLKNIYQGWQNIAHGGIVATILDEAMAWAVMRLGISAVTAKLNVRYKHPTPIGESLKVIGEVIRQEGRALQTRAELLDERNMLLAEAEAVYMEVGSEVFRG